ncbi:MAG: MFS transporter [Lachnospira sp.]
MNSKKLAFLYILIHGFFWCTYAITWSYTAMYLQSCGYSSSIVGIVTGVGAVISIILQPVLAKFTSKFRFMNNSSNILMLKLISIVIGAVMMVKLPGLYTTAFLFTFAAAIDASIPSILSCVAMDSINSGVYINYGVARGCGSVAYAVFSFLLGVLVQFLGVSCLMPLYIGTGLITVILVWLFIKSYEKKIRISEVKGSEAKAHRESEPKNEMSLSGILKKYSFLKWLLLASVFLFMGHNMINVFMLNIIENAGGSSANLGLALAISAMVELPVMVSFVGLSRKISTEKLLVISAVCFTVKSIFTCFAGTLMLVYLSQLMQIGAFAVFTPASVYFINQKMLSEDSGMGQALLGSCSLGLGGTLGNIIGGFVLDGFGLPGMLMCASVLSAFGIVSMIRCVKCK